MKNFLFVCEGNEVRSPTFESWFLKNRSVYYNVKSAGIRCLGDGQKLTLELLEWADNVYVADIEQEMFISRNFPDFLEKVEVIGCEDIYYTESPQLFEVIEYWVKKKNL
jgi:predicted protein tyrosine phosphatase